MAELRLTKVEQGPTKIRTVPVAVTPEGFWCCPYPVVFQKTVKTQNPQNKPKPSPPAQNISSQRKQASEAENKPSMSSSRRGLATEEQKMNNHNEETQRPKPENVPRKVTIEFGEPGTSDLKLVLLEKQGITVKLSVHRSVLVENSNFFANKILIEQIVFPCIEIEECDDVEAYIETVGLMYCNELKKQLIKQSVSHVLRILKVAETLGFTRCIQSCLEYLEAVPWVGEEEEEKVVSTVLRLKPEGFGVKPILKRMSPDPLKPPKDTIFHVLELVLKSNNEKGRRDMKSIVLKLLEENNSSGSSDLCIETIYTSCRNSVNSMLSLSRQAAEPDVSDTQEPIATLMALEADNLIWLIDILSDSQAADEFALIWTSQQELVSLHTRLAIVDRHHISKVTARLFVGIGRREILPSVDTRHLLVKMWLEALIDDYGWLRHACRSFDQTVVDEGICRTILTLPLEDQQNVLLSWMGKFLKGGDNCPNLRRAFEVWWRRTFIRPYVETGTSQEQDGKTALEQ